MQINIEIQISFNPNYTYDGKKTLIVINIFPPKCQQHTYIVAVVHVTFQTYLGIDKEKKTSIFLVARNSRDSRSNDDYH